MVDKETIERLSIIHINRFANMVRAGESGNRNIVLGECKAYLKTWKAIQMKGDWDSLDKIERRELMDAVRDESDV